MWRRRSLTHPQWPESLAQRSFAEALAVARRAQQRTHVSAGEYKYNYTLRGIPWYTLARRYKDVTLRCWVYPALGPSLGWAGVLGLFIPGRSSGWRMRSRILLMCKRRA